MPVRLMPTRHSPFYTPFLVLHTAGFLKQEGLDSELRIPKEGESAGVTLRRGDVDVIQSAVSAAWIELDKGTADIPIHIAQINQRDGFFIVAREPDPAFAWSKLEGRTLLADHGHQPLIMLRWAAHNKGAEWSKISVINAGAPAAMEAAFRAGQGDYLHLQGGVPQQMEFEKAGFVVASAGEGLTPLAFSSIAVAREFVECEEYRPFLAAFANARRWAQEADPAEVANAVAPLFPGLAPQALTAAISAIQKIGCWQGRSRIPHQDYAQAERVFLWSQGINQPYPYRAVCYDPE